MNIHSPFAGRKFSVAVVAGGLWLLLTLAMLGPGNALACGASPGGNPGGCGGGGPATQINPNIQTGGGNPINLINGNKYQEETDLTPLPGVLGLELKRHYNSQSTYAGWMGAGWRTSYEAVLYDLGGQIQIVQADGRRLMFQRGIGSNAALCSSPQIQDGHVRIEPPLLAGGQATYHWRWPDGRILTFSGGKGGGFPLREIKAPGGQRLMVNYHLSGELATIVDPQGRQLVFSYGQAPNKQGRVLQAVDTPLGRITYGRDDLNRVTEVAYFEKPAALDASKQKASTMAVPPQPYQTKVYHYEDSLNAGNRYALTGISLRAVDAQTQKLAEQRLSTYAYNAAGLAIMSTKGRPRELKDGQVVAGTGMEQVDVNIVEKSLPFEGQPDKTTGEVKPRQLGKTILTNSLGQKTEIKHTVIGGNYRLIEMRGPGCSTCGPSNMRYAYDVDGRLLRETQFDSNGQPLRSEVTRYDEHGRVAQVGMQLHSGKPTTANAVQWSQRFEYKDATLPDGRVSLPAMPSAVAKPSVMAGKEQVTHFSYTEEGLPQQVTETGWSPVDEKGQRVPAGVAISRTTRFTYAIVNGRRLLSEVDGPLPNGPQNSPSDSDIVRLTWDATGDNVVSMTEHGGFASAVSYNVQGQITLVKNSEGVSTELFYNPQGQLASIRSSGPGWKQPRVESYQYDALGRMTQVATSLEGEKSYRPQMAQAFDLQGQLLWRASALGVMWQNRYDTESRLLESGRHGAGMSQVERLTYDERGHLTRVADSRGAVYAMAYDHQGLLSRITDALGRVQQKQTPNQANAAVPGAPRPRIWRDDFGRTVAVLSPDSGWRTWAFNAADQLIVNTDALGNRAQYQYDAAGRILLQTVRASNAAAPDNLTSWTYRGKRLVALDHPTQKERYEYDERGLRTATTVTLQTTQGEHSSVTRHTYDDEGMLVATSLPDGSRVVFRRDGLDQVIEVTRERVHTAWLRWLAPAQTLAKDIQRDLVGLARYTAGNGIEAHYARSREGALARVVYRNPKVRVGQTAFNVLPSLLGVGTAHAAEATTPRAAAAPAASAAAASSPGALGHPTDPQALMDHRYLWDVQGNLLHTQSRTGAGHAVTLTDYAYDMQDRLLVAVSTPGGSTAGDPAVTPVAAKSAFPSASLQGSASVSRYHYDRLGRRVLSQEGGIEQSDFNTGTRRARYDNTNHRWLGDEQRESAQTTGEHSAANPVQYDASGQPLQVGQRRYVWDAFGRLVEVKQQHGGTSASQEATLASYRYNHRGERISKTVDERSTHYLYQSGQLSAELNEQGRVVRQYVYLADLPFAVIDTPQGVQAAGDDVRSAWSQAMHDLRTLAQQWFASDEKTTYLHTNHLGAVEAATGHDGQLVWQTRYSAFGQAHMLHATSAQGSGTAFTLNLRLPGQYEDAETGLFYNKARYYDPARGEYLTPDPLGTPDGPNPYSYVRYNPLKYIDPLGLVLFAFDGTGNDESNAATLSNVVRFKELYNDGKDFYITGAGTKDPATGIEHPFLLGGSTADMGFSFTGKARVAAMVTYLNNYADGVDDSTAFDIDITGFSRGSAQARDFSNQIVAKTNNGWYSYTVKDKEGVEQKKCQKVNFRFMGLWDTVLSTHKGSYQLGIPKEFSYVAHATALNEYRGALVEFPLESILGVPAPAGTTRIERGFLGAHSDIGGGFPDQDLAKVAMVWMVNQATAAGVNMKPMSAAQTTLIANPVFHDKSNHFSAAAPPPASYGEDRDVRLANGSTVKQRQMTDLGQRMTYADTLKFMTYYPNPLSFDNISGHVDAKKYLEWLNKNGYGLESINVY